MAAQGCSLERVQVVLQALGLLGLRDGIQRVGDRNAAFADRQKGVVVLGIADAHDVVGRQREFVERRLESACLVDRRR